MISVIIPTYNRATFLPRAIGSVLAQSYADLELIVVDDRSLDGSEAVIKEFAGKDSRIRYVKNKHSQGPAGARNQGVDEARGEFIAFLDSDDEWKEWHLEETLGYFKVCGNVDWIYADIERVENGRLVTRSNFNERWKGKERFIVYRARELVVFEKKDLLTAALRYGTYAAPQCSVIRRRVFDTIRFAEDLFGIEDRLLPLEAISRGFSLAYIDKVHVRYHVHPGSLSDNAVMGAGEGKLSLYREIVKYYQSLPCRIPLTREQQGIVSRQLAMFYFWQLGYNYYMRKGDTRNAGSFFLKGLMLDPCNLSFWKTYITRMILKVRDR